MKTFEELKEQARQLCYAIELLPCSTQATDLSVMASNLLHAMDEKVFIDGAWEYYRRMALRNEIKTKPLGV